MNVEKKERKKVKKEDLFFSTGSRTPTLSHTSPSQFHYTSLWKVRTIGIQHVDKPQATHTLFLIYLRGTIEPFKRMYENASKITLISTCSKKVKKINDAYIFLIKDARIRKSVMQRQNIFQKIQS